MVELTVGANVEFEPDDASLRALRRDVESELGGGGGGLLRTLAPFAALPFAGGSIADAARDDVDNPLQGIGLTTPLLPLAGAVQGAAGLLPGAPTDFGGDRATRGPNAPGPTTPSGDMPQDSELAQDLVDWDGIKVNTSDRQLVESLVESGEISASSKLAQLARSDNRTFDLAEGTARRLELLRAAIEQNRNAQGGPRTTGGSSIPRDQVGTFRSTGDTTVNVQADVSVKDDRKTERKIEDAMDQTKQEVIEEARRKLTVN